MKRGGWLDAASYWMAWATVESGGLRGGTMEEVTNKNGE